jgi:hypothetical protein
MSKIPIFIFIFYFFGRRHEQEDVPFSVLLPRSQPTLLCLYRPFKEEETFKSTKKKNKQENHKK